MNWYRHQLPLIKPVGRNQAAVFGEAAVERGLFGHRLGTCVVHLGPDARVFRPIGHQAPAHHLPHPPKHRLMPDNQHVTRRRNVVARREVRTGSEIELLHQSGLGAVESIVSPSRRWRAGKSYTGPARTTRKTKGSRIETCGPFFFIGCGDRIRSLFDDADSVPVPSMNA